MELEKQHRKGWSAHGFAPKRRKWYSISEGAEKGNGGEPVRKNLFSSGNWNFKNVFESSVEKLTQW